MTASPIVEIRQLSKTYPGAGRPAVDGVDLAIAHGRIFGLLGPNGAGKTTLLSMLCGLLPPSSGSLRIRGQDVRHQDAAIKRRLGLAPQDLALYPYLTARENLAYFGGMLGLHGAALRRRLDYCLDTAGLNDVADRRVETFSGGLKRRLNLVIALLHEPELLILDEPTVGIDPQSRRFIHENLKRLNAEGMSIIYTSHYMEEVEQLCDEVAIIDHGRIIAQGSVDGLLAAPREATIELRTSVPPPPAAQAALRALAHVHTAEFDGKFVVLTSAAPQTVAPAAMRLLHENGVETTSLSFGAMHLEQVFLALTGTRLRN